MDELKLRWKYLAEGFPNIIDPSEVDCLVDEVVKLKTLEGLDDETEPEEFFKDLSTVKDINGNQVFPLVITSWATHLHWRLCP